MKVMNMWDKCRSLLPKVFLWDGCMLWPSLYITARILYWYEPWQGSPITRFDRVMGNATLSDVLISSRTGQSMLTLLVFIPLLLALSWAVVSFCLGPGKAYANRREFSGWLSAFSGVGLCAMALDYARQFGTMDDIWMTEAQVVPLVMVGCTLIWCAYRRGIAEDKVGLSADNVKQMLLSGLVLSFPVQMMAHFGTYTAVISGLCVIIALISCMVLSQFKCSWVENTAHMYSSLPSILMLPAMLLCLEVCNILNQYGVFVKKTQTLLWVVVFVCLISSSAIGRIAQARLKRRSVALIGTANPTEWKLVRDWRDYWYPIIIAGFAGVAGYHELQEFVGSDFFERANQAVSINGFLNFGQIPTVETHAAHMGYDYLGGIFWGLVNGDAYAASFTRYNGIYLTLTFLVFYYLLRRLVGRDHAFVAALILPVMETSHSAGDWYAHLAYLPALVLAWVIEKPSFRRYVVFWFAAAFSVLYRGDIGLSLGVACVVVMLIHTILQKKISAYKLYFGSFGAVGGGMALVLVIVCLIKGINPISRLWEFLQITAMSNQDWAYTSLGATGNPGFAWTFLITPIALLAMLYVILVRLAQRQVALRIDHWMFFTFVGGYFFNFPRTLVRHSLAESIPVYCLAMGMWALALGVWLLWKDRAPVRRNGGVVLSAMLVISLLVTAIMFNGQFLSSKSLFLKAHDNFEGGAITFPQLVKGDGYVHRVKKVTSTVQRVVLPPEMVKTAETLEKALDNLLDEDDTWLDFTNQSTLYALLNRRSPVFVNQSPGLLSGDYSQKCFIEQIEKQKDDVPVALLPNSPMLLGYNLDGVQNSLRYYRVAEYIYNNYVPYGTAAGYAIWVRPERLEAMKLDVENSDEKEDGRLTLSADGLRPVNCSIRNENGALVIAADGNDPQVDSFHSLLSGSGFKGGTLTMNISYISDTTGELQLFWKDSGRNYDEENSLRVPISATATEKTVQLVVDWNTTQLLRLDIPDNANFTITKIVTDATLAVSNDYSYGSYNETHVYNMGAIARLWGEQDTEEACENTFLGELPKQKTGIYELSESHLGGENGRYIRVKINFQGEEGSAALNLVQTNEKGHASPLATFNFDLSEGHHVYLIRVSCDSNWYSGEVDGVQITAPGVYSVSVLEGD